MVSESGMSEGELRAQGTVGLTMPMPPANDPG